MIASEIKDLWGIYYNRQHLDPRDLTQAIEDQVRSGDLDYRTRLLIRESLDALRDYWGQDRLAVWMNASPVRNELEEISCFPFDDETGFPSLRRRVMDVTRPEMILSCLREIGLSLHRPLRVCIGGSVVYILGGYLARKTEDIDIVDEVPSEIRTQYKLLDALHERYDLKVGHFQSHYLPSGWEKRLHPQGSFGQLQVDFVDIYDLFLGKLTSIRDKDLSDLARLAPQLDKEVLVDRLRTTMASTFAAEPLRQRAEKNWYVLFGEALPT